MAETVRVWVKTSVIEQVLYGKSKSSSKRRALPDDLNGLASSGDDGICNWGWARAELIRESSAASKKSSSAGSVNKGDKIAVDDKPVKVYVKDEESEHNRSTIDIPPDLARQGVVMDNIWADDEDDDEDGGGGGGGFVSREGPPDDLIHLTHLHEPAVVYCLRRRYAYDKIYTATGPILLALNPFKNCKSLYNEKMMHSYSRRGELMALSGKKGGDGGGGGDGAACDDLPPHVYAVADHSFRAMMRLFEDDHHRGQADKTCDQSILVSGESGAGKTVTTKFIMQYLASLSEMGASSTRHLGSGGGGGGAGAGAKIAGHHKGSTEQQVLRSNPILESFGNARTIRNDNSSRFGKFIELEFTSLGSLIGASIETYLLEKVRLVTQTPGERNYHIFYELLVGMEEEELDKYYIGADTTAEDFQMTNMSGTFDRRDGVDDYDTFVELKEAMDTMGFEPSEQENIMTVTCALLHCSNVGFVALSADESAVDRENPALDPVLSLLGVTADALNQALCYFSIMAGKEKHMRSVPKTKAEKGMEGLIKATYGALFSWIVKRINSSITVKDSATPKRGSARAAANKKAKIGVLDIFGFESFKKNSFEQLCINYCNEALQQQFNLFVLKNEQEEYEREGIKWSFISFPENQDVLDLIWKKGAGILNILDDQCRAPGTTDKTFATDIYQKCTGHPRFEADFRQVGARLFGVFHYAGPVEYDTEGFVEKNRDELPKEATDLLMSSSNEFVRALANIVSGGPAGGTASASPSPAAAGGGAPRGRRPISRSGSGAARGSNAKTTVGSQFSSQLTELRRKIDLTSPHYVRCLKPNDLLVPDHFDPVIIADQLRCAGVVEAVRVSRVGYPQRYTHANFVKRYRILALKELKKAARASTRRQKTCDVLVCAIAKKIYKIENPDAEQGVNDKKGKSDDIDLVSVGIQVGKTKVFLRSHAYEIMEQLRSHQMDDATVLMQTTARGYVARREYKRVLQSVLMVQCAVRKMYAREEMHTLKLNHSATLIQRACRKSVARRSYLMTLYAARWMQRVRRGQIDRARYERLNRERKATMIQTCWRRHYHSQRYERIAFLTLAVQCLLRCYNARHVLKELKAQARNLNAVADERDALKAQVQRMKEELQVARRKAKEESDRAASIGAEHAAEKASLVDSAEINDLRMELERTREELGRATEKAKEESERADKAELSLKTVTGEMEILKNKSDQIRMELNQSKEKETTEAGKITVLENTVDDLRAEVKRLETVSATPIRKAADQSSEIEALRNELQEARNASREKIEVAARPSSPRDVSSTEEMNRLREEIDLLRKELETANEMSAACRREADRRVEEKHNEIEKLLSEIASFNHKLEDADADLEDAQQKRQNQPALATDAAPSLPDKDDLQLDFPPSVPNGHATVEIEYLRSEIVRLEDELKNAKDAVGNADSPASLKARYEELIRLSNACLEKDQEISKLRTENSQLQDDLKEVRAFHNSGRLLNTVPPLDAANEDTKVVEADELEDDASSLGFDDVTSPTRDLFIAFRRKTRNPPPKSTAEDESALKAVNEMLRNEVEQLRKELAETKAKAKEEAEQSARDLEAFAEALHGVDEMRRAAEQMSRELKLRRRSRIRGGDHWETQSMRDDISVVSGGTEIFREASQILDRSNRQANNAHHLWARVRNQVSGRQAASSRGLMPVREGCRSWGNRNRGGVGGIGEIEENGDEN